MRLGDTSLIMVFALLLSATAPSFALANEAKIDCFSRNFEPIEDAFSDYSQVLARYEAALFLTKIRSLGYLNHRLLAAFIGYMRAQMRGSQDEALLAPFIARLEHVLNILDDRAPPQCDEEECVFRLLDYLRARNDDRTPEAYHKTVAWTAADLAAAALRAIVPPLDLGDIADMQVACAGLPATSERSRLRRRHTESPRALDAIRRVVSGRKTGANCVASQSLDS